MFKSPPAQVRRAFEIALEALNTDRVRTRSAVVALAIAMTIVVCLTALVERGRASTIRALERAGLTNIYLVRLANPDVESHSALRLTLATLRRIQPLLPPCSIVAIHAQRGRAFAASGVSFDAPVYAMSGPLNEALGIRIRNGRPLGDLDVERKSSYCVVGAQVPRLAGLGRTLGGALEVGRRSYEVVGELAQAEVETASTGEVPSLDWDQAVIVPLGSEPGALQEADDRYPLDTAIFRFRTISDADRAALAAESILRSRPVGERSFRVVSPIQTLRQYKQTRRAFDRVVWLVCVLTAASAVFGISNQLSASVIARTREIGVRRAVGARPIDIVMQFQAEGVLLGVFGGGVGLVAGLLLSLVTVDRSAGGFSMSLASVCSLAAGSVVAGILTGIRPSARAARIDPAAALREG